MQQPVDLKALRLAILAAVVTAGCAFAELLLPPESRQPILAVMSVFLAWGITRLEGVRFRDLGWGKVWLWLVGTVLMIVVHLARLALAWGPGGMAFKPEITITGIMPFFVWVTSYHAMVAFWEEIVFRGLVTRLLCRAFDVLTGTLLGALLFALPHLLVPHPTLGELVRDFLGGAIYMTLYIGSGSLWLPMGAHWSWNFMSNLNNRGLISAATLAFDPTIIVLTITLLLAGWWASRHPRIDPRLLANGGDRRAA